MASEFLQTQAEFLQAKQQVEQLENPHAMPGVGAPGVPGEPQQKTAQPNAPQSMPGQGGV